MADIGFIGLGIMGTPMARHLQDAGHSLYTSKFFIAPKQELIDNGLKIVESPKGLGGKDRYHHSHAAGYAGREGCSLR